MVREPMYNIYLSYAPEDKARFVEPLVQALRARGKTVGYAQDPLDGGHLTQNAIKGELLKSEYGVVVLSPDFFQHRPKRELRDLLALKSHVGHPIFSIALHVDWVDILQTSPTVGGPVPICAQIGINAIADALCTKMNQRAGHPHPPPPQSSTGHAGRRLSSRASLTYATLVSLLALGILTLGRPRSSSPLPPTIHLSLPSYTASLSQRKEHAHRRLEQTHGQEKRALQADVSATKTKLKDVTRAYQTHIQRLQADIGRLQTLRAEVPREPLASAIKALRHNKRSKTEAMFETIKQQSMKNASAKAWVAAEAAYQQGRTAEEQFLFIKAQTFYVEATTLAPQNPVYLSALGNIFFVMGSYERATSFYERARTEAHQALGDNLPFIADIYNHLSNVWLSRGDETKATEFHLKALQTSLESLGEDHPALSATYLNLGSAWSFKGNYDKAIEFYLKALAVAREGLGENHPKVVKIYNNLGLAWSDKGRYAQALKCYLKALEITQQINEEQHSILKTPDDYLAAIWPKVHQQLPSIELHQKDLEITRDSLGENHPSVAISYSNLGYAWYTQGNLDLSKKCYEIALAILRSQLGEHHPHTRYILKRFEELQQYSQNWRH